MLERTGQIAVAVFVAAALAWALFPYKFDRFDERPIAVAALPKLARDEVLALEGGRCVEQYASVYFCTSVRPNQGNEGPRQREWCYDSDGPGVLETYPARRALGFGPRKCRAG